MAFKAASRVRETTTTTGTGTLTLAGASTGFQSFSSGIGNGNTCHYCCTDGTAWEVGIGTVGAGTLARTTVLASSNAGALVNFSAGTKTVICTLAGEAPVASITQMTEATTTSGTSVDITSIPANVKFLLVAINGVSVDAATNKVLRLRDSSGWYASGYASVCVSDGSVSYTSSTGFVFSGTNQANTSEGVIVLARVNAIGTKWSCSAVMYETTSVALMVAGSLQMTGELTGVRLTSISGTANFDAGSYNVIYAS